MNALPIVDRELRVAARRPATFYSRFWGAGLILLLWGVVQSQSRDVAPSEMGLHSLNALGVATPGFCLLAGIFLASDCVSRERREGTLGLLYLTSLRSHDVALGKLAANSLNAYFGLLAILPVLSLPVLTGGVTGGEFCRLVLVFVATLFFSLGLGMAASAAGTEARQTLSLGLFLLLLFTALCPALWWAQRGLWNFPGLGFLSFPSPVYTYNMAFDASYRGAREAAGFWASLTTVFGLGCAGVISAGLLVPRSLREIDQPGTNVPATRPSRATRTLSPPDRLPLDDARPFHWLAARDSGAGRLSGMFLAGLGALWAVFLLISVGGKTTGDAAFTITLFLSYGMHLIVKILVATEASHRMHAGRQSGAWELVLCSPQPVENILEGQMSGLRDRFRRALLVLVAVNTALLGSVYQFGKELDLGEPEDRVFTVVFVGGVLALVGDFYSLCWVGMRRGLEAKRHHVAMAATLLEVCGPAWLVVFLLFFLRPRADSPDLLIGGWIVLGTGLAAFRGRRSRAILKAKFRSWAAR